MAKKFGANKILVPKEFWSIKNFNVKNGTNIARTNVSWTDVTCHGHTCNLLKSMTTGWDETNFLGRDQDREIRLIKFPTRPRPRKMDADFFNETRPR